MMTLSPVARAWRVVSAVLLGVIFFGVVMATAIALIRLNAGSHPDFAWFPLPLTLTLVAATALADRYGHIGLRRSRTARMASARVWLLALLVTNAGVMACALQGYFTGYVRDAELLPGVDSGFQRTYAIYMAVFAAVLAEVSFRGIMQTRMHTALGPWTVIVTVGLINVFAHRWDTDILQNGIGWFVILAGWAWLRWLSGSLWPPLLMHAGVNAVVALWIWYVGPIEHAAMSPVAVTAVAAMGILSIGFVWRLGRRLC